MTAVFGCTSGPGFQPERLSAASDSDGRLPRYVAEGRDIVNVMSGRRQTPPMARDAAANLLDSALAIRDDGCADSDLRILNDLVRAIREAERNDPLPPATIMRAA